MPVAAARPGAWDRNDDVRSRPVVQQSATCAPSPCPAAGPPPGRTPRARNRASLGGRQSTPAVVVTSMPRRVSPSATADGTCSSRWNRISPAIVCHQLLDQLGSQPPSHRLGEGFPSRMSSRNLVLMVEVVGERRCGCPPGTVRGSAPRCRLGSSRETRGRSPHPGPEYDVPRCVASRPPAGRRCPLETPCGLVSGGCRIGEGARGFWGAGLLEVLDFT